MKKSTVILHNIFANIPTTVVFCWFVQQLAIWQGNQASFSWISYWINFPIGYCTGLICGFFLPGVIWGQKFANKLGANEGSMKYALLLNVIANTVNTTVLIIVMTYVNVCLFGHAPLSALIPGILGCYIPVWIIGYIISFLTVPVCRRLAEKCTGA